MTPTKIDVAELAALFPRNKHHLNGTNNSLLRASLVLSQFFVFLFVQSCMKWFSLNCTICWAVL